MKAAITLSLYFFSATPIKSYAHIFSKAAESVLCEISFLDFKASPYFYAIPIDLVNVY